MGKIRILFIIPTLYHGGTNRVLENILSLINSEKLDVSVLSLWKSSEKDPYYAIFSDLSNLVLLEDIAQSFFYNLLYNRFANKFHGMMRKWFNNNTLLNLCVEKVHTCIEYKLKPDIIIAFEEGGATLFASKFKCKKIAWIHCDYSNFLKIQKPSLDYEHSIYNQFDTIVCVSKYTADSFKRIFRDLSHKVMYIYNPTNANSIISKSLEPVDDPICQQDVFNIVSVGRYAEVKQFHLIPDIVRDILKLNDKVKFRWYIIGDGSEKLKNETLSKIAKYGIEEYVVLLGARENPYPYMKASNLYVCTSYSEAYPCVLNEAKVLGLPVVTNNFPSSKEIIDEKSGVIVEFDDIPLAIANIIKKGDNRCEGVPYSDNKENDNNFICNQIMSLIER